MTTAYIALGSNLGDRLENLRFAARKLEDSGVLIAAFSKIYQSASVGTGGDGDFLNAVLRVQTEFSALQLLALCQGIEIEAGREPSKAGKNRVGPRSLDVDILLFGEDVYTSPELQIPHPRALGRNFVLRPLLDVLEGGALEASEATFKC